MGKGISSELKTKYNTSTTLITTIKINPDAISGFYDVIVKNPVCEAVVLKNGFRVVR